MEPKEKTNDKENLQINQQPKKTWQEPVLKTWEHPAMTKLDINAGISPAPVEGTTYYLVSYLV
jgi:hypothetical protein